MKNLKLHAFYGELSCPDSMMYCDGLTTVLEVSLNRDYDSPEMQALLAEIDQLIRSRITVEEL